MNDNMELTVKIEYEGIDYEVFAKRATVSLTRRLQVAIPAYFQARKLWKRAT
jgi:hypothetical protein